MADVTYYKGYIGEEDLNIGLSTFVRRDKDGAYRQLTQINKDTFKIDWYFDVRDYADFPTAVTELNALGVNCSLLISEECVVSADVNCNKEIYLMFRGEGILNIDSGYVVTINSDRNIIAPTNQRIFSGLGTVSFSLPSTLHPAWFGTPKDGSTNSALYFTAINAAMVADSTIELEPDGNYYINTAGGFTLSKKVHVKGFGAKFTIGATVGNAPAITVSASESMLEDFEIDCTLNHTDDGDDDFQDAGDVLTTNLRRALKVTGNNVTCERIETTTAVVGIEYNGTTGGEIHHCRLTNATIKSSGAASASNNYNAGINLYSATDCKVHNNYIDGHGQNILQGSYSYRNKIYANTCLNASNNGIYLSSGTDCEVWDNTVRVFDGDGIKVRDSYHNIHHNRVFGDNSDYSVNGIAVTGNGADDGDGWNGRGSIVQANIINGDFTNGIATALQDSYYLRDIQILDNEIVLETGGDSVQYGIHIYHSTASSSTNASKGIVISGNTIKNHSLGIYANAEAGKYHDNMVIENNQVIGGTNDNITLQNLRYGKIHDNDCGDAAAGLSAITLTGCSYCKVYNNDAGDHQAVATQSYSVEEKTGSDYNLIEGNDVTNQVSGYPIVLVGANTVAKNNIYSAVDVSTYTTAGDRTIAVADMYPRIHLRDPNGAARVDTTDTKTNISGGLLWNTGSTWEIIYINTGEAAETITIAGGTAVTVYNQEGAGDAVIPAGCGARLLFVKTTTAAIKLFVTVFEAV